MFLSSAATPGNGGPLQQPRGQTSVFYSVPDAPDPAKQAAALARSQAAVEAAQAGVRRAAAGDGNAAEPGEGEGVHTAGREEVQARAGTGSTGEQQ
ncbi:hypothetical protein TSOC_001215 [Tetrabaena socialis]|uniref:Uncharacterized protein n=1 Tax=Tetrabaena socialis TaxID=47790 RepID=A0A2J8AH90_9CHLO|nr:hypothetical protein TSOC_001215 [Tetrabaena socialis]|eukprot:PNH11888.1 hypothetical protein TSOC_001215 [Tetrabaena socialis]